MMLAGTPTRLLWKPLRADPVPIRWHNADTAVRLVSTILRTLVWRTTSELIRHDVSQISADVLGGLSAADHRDLSSARQGSWLKRRAIRNEHQN